MTIPLPFTAFQDRAGITLDDVKTRIGLDDDTFDDDLTALLTEALQEADRFTKNPFLVTLEPNSILMDELPASALQGVYAYFLAEWRLRVPPTVGTRKGIADTVEQGPIQSSKVGDVSKTFAAATSGSVAGLEMKKGLTLGLVAAIPFWKGYRLSPGIVRRLEARGITVPAFVP